MDTARRALPIPVLVYKTRPGLRLGAGYPATMFTSLPGT